VTPVNASLVFRIAECRARDLLRRENRLGIRAREFPHSGLADQSSELSLALAVDIARLPEEARRVMELKRAGYSERETAQLLNLGRKVVRSRFAWALRFLGRSQQH